MGETEVTQKQYLAVMGNNPSKYKTSSDHPVEMVSWYDAVKFCNELSDKEGLTPYYTISGDTVTIANTEGIVGTSGVGPGTGYRLPTEAEWEYAAGGGASNRDTTLFAGTSDIDDLATYAVYNRSDDEGTTVVKNKRANGLGLYDMTGNVYEYCWARVGWPPTIFPSEELTNPTGVVSEIVNDRRNAVLHGGAYYDDGAQRLSVIFRTADPVDGGENGGWGSVGFRVVRSVAP